MLRMGVVVALVAAGAWPSAAAAGVWSAPQVRSATAAGDSGRGAISGAGAASDSAADGAPHTRGRARLALGRKPGGKSARFDAPRWVMLRSMLVPGWGQAHNQAWLKALGVAAGEGYFAMRLLDDRRILDRLLAQVDEARADGDDELERELVDRYNARLGAYTSRQWLTGALFVYAIVDAYVDAHFRSFKVEFEGDPALPAGQKPPSVRAALRWRF